MALIAAMLCGLALAACGGDDDGGSGGGSDEDQVRELAEQLAGSDPAVCDNFSESFLKDNEITVEECEKAAEEEEDTDAKATVEEVSVDGDKATAVVVDDDRSTVEFVKEGDEWLVNGVKVKAGAGDGG